LFLSKKFISILISVIKASLISNDSIQAGDPYTFPNANDDLSKFTGGHTQFTFPNVALKEVLETLPEGGHLQCII